MKIVVYTAIFGGKDIVCEDQPDGCDYVLWTDLPPVSGRWKTNTVPQARDFFRQSRFYKLLPHRCLADYDFSIWIDGNMQLIVRPADLIVQFLEQTGHFHAQQVYDVAQYAPAGSIHSNLYHEAALCARLGKDDPVTIAKQVETYRRIGVPDDTGLWMGGIIIRRHNHPCSAVLGEAWYNEICRYSRRDQIALPAVLWKLGLNIQSIPAEYKMTIRHPHLKAA